MIYGIPVFQIITKLASKPRLKYFLKNYLHFLEFSREKIVSSQTNVSTERCQCTEICFLKQAGNSW